MKQIRIYITLLFMSVLTSSAVAQYVSPVDFMRNNPRSVFANPATYTVDNGYFDMFLGGINIGVQNIGLKYDKFFQFNAQGQPSVIDLDNGVASLRDQNYVNTYLNFDIFHCGKRTKYGYFTYSHRVREMQSLSYSKDLVQLAAQGNASFLGESNPANIEIGVAARAVQEFDFGYQMSLTNDLNIGLRLKFLMGFADAKTNALNVQLFTDPTTYALSVKGLADLRVSLPYQITMENGQMKLITGQFNPATLFKNYGGGIDLGAEYKINNQFGVAAAINDLGFISWDNYSATMTGQIQDAGHFYDNGAFVFSGLNPDQIDGLMNQDGYFEKLMDSLVDYFQLTPTTMTKYTSGLNTNMMVRGYYDLTPEHRFSAQLMGYNLGLGMKPAVTLAYTGSFANKYDLVATYTMMGGSYDNIGIGMSANFGGILLYMASNNVFGFFNPANRSQLNFQFGITLTSGTFTDRREKVVIGGTSVIWDDEDAFDEDEDEFADD